MKQKVLVEGNPNLLKKNEILISQEEGYTIFRSKDASGKIETSVLVPLSDFIGNEDKES